MPNWKELEPTLEMLNLNFESIEHLSSCGLSININGPDLSVACIGMLELERGEIDVPAGSKENVLGQIRTFFDINPSSYGNKTPFEIFIISFEDKPELIITTFVYNEDETDSYLGVDYEVNICPFQKDGRIIWWNNDDDDTEHVLDPMGWVYKYSMDEIDQPKITIMAIEEVVFLDVSNMLRPCG